ncbi:hypothetical protein FQA39_LY01736 [Lamprigera yunnana]|nr:hypothetical protein FQA39_LY01736 [Lamprigera yunnana]
MASKVVIFTLMAALAVSCCSAVYVAAPAAYVAPYASSYSSHVVNHGVVAPVAAPLVAPAAAYAAYAAHPYSYAAPLVVGK